MTRSNDIGTGTAGAPCRRVVFLVLDGVGAGALPDAAAYGDADADTLGNLSRLVPLRLPVLQRLGLGNIVPMRGVPPAKAPATLPALLAERSPGKDSTTGHWEHMGLVRQRPFPTYPQGFPPEVVTAFTQSIGRGVIGNKVASGTEIIRELGTQHIASGDPILYTSEDSVFQLAAHVDIVPPQLLYEWCAQARALLAGPHEVGRVIARPFQGEPGSFVRTKGRRDFSVPPSGPTYLDRLQEHGVPVHGVGKVVDLFAGRGFSTTTQASGNADVLRAVSEALAEGHSGLIFANLVDFDMEWGHRNDAERFAAALVYLDSQLGRFLSLLEPTDALIITADHGCDPTTASTEHSREHVPLLLHLSDDTPAHRVRRGYFSDSGATVFALLTGREPDLAGRDLRDIPASSRFLRSVQPGTGVPPAVPPRRRGRSRGAQRADARRAASNLSERLGDAPERAVILGSGLDALLAQIDAEAQCRFQHIHGWRDPGVAGHRGIVVVGRLEGVRAVFLSGRAHLYEGVSPDALSLPIFSLREWGVEQVTLTYAAGALNDRARAGSALVIGTVMDFQGFPGGSSRPTNLRIGPEPSVYAALPGPQYETRADVRVLAALGADVVGMSCAVEVRAARAAGLALRVVAIVTNRAGETHTDHEAVLREAARAAGGAARLVLPV